MIFPPSRFSDEILFSWLGRWRAHCAMQSPKHILLALFEQSDVRVGLLLQGHLTALSKHLPREPDNLPLALARNMTLANYYTSTATLAKRQKTISALVAGDYGWIACELGLSASAVRPPTHLKFCAQCSMQDLSIRGETCWRRAHQLPGVLVCHVHGAPLVEVRWKVRSVAQHVLPILEADEVQRPYALPKWVQSKSAHRFLYQIAVRSAALLTTNTSLNHQPYTGEKWRSALRDRGFGKGTKNLDRTAILDAYRDFVSPISAFLSNAKAGPWLDAISRKHRKVINPLHHILMSMFVEAIQLKPAEQPFGSGPWPCQNPLEKHCGTGTITRVRTRIDGRKVVGRFACECGYEYSQPAGGGRIVVYCYGSQFDRILSECIASQSGLRATARRLHVDPLTVRRHAQRLGLKTLWKPLEMKVSHTPTQTSVRRDRWRDLNRQFPDATPTQRRKRSPADWTWLSRNDGDWLKRMSPANAKTSFAKPRADWAKLDQDMQKRVTDASTTILAAIPFRRVTIAAIEREMGKPDYFRTRTRKLPQTYGTACAMVETIAQFQCRRINQLVAEMRANQEIIRVWQVRRAAGLGASTTKDAATLLARLERLDFEDRKSVL